MREYERTDKLSENRLPQYAYAIPYESLEKALAGNAAKAGITACLTAIGILLIFTEISMSPTIQQTQSLIPLYLSPPVGKCTATSCPFTVILIIRTL